jgi:hypothetical protein
MMMMNGGGGGPPSQYRHSGSGGGSVRHQQQQQQQHHLVDPILQQAMTNNNGDQGGVTDTESFTSDADKLSAILKCSDVEMHKHMLAVDYFRHRKNVLHVPIILMSLFIAVCGFVAASDVIKESYKVEDTTLRDFLALVAASLGFAVMLLAILAGGLDYPTKMKFHRSAAEDMAQLSDRVRLYRMERAMDERAEYDDEELRELFMEEDDRTEDMTVMDDEDDDIMIGGGANNNDVEMQIQQYRGGGQIVPHSGAAAGIVRARVRAAQRNQRRHEKLTRTLVRQKVRRAREEQDLSRDAIAYNGYHATLNQISRGCRSDVPPRLSKFFHIMENRVELMSLSRLGVKEDTRTRRYQIVRMCAIEIYNEVSNFFFWPLFAPNVDRTVEASLKRVGQLLNMKYRARRRCKLIPCCPIPLCCKKKTTDNVFAIINEGIDQRELDMMQVERAELLRMEREGRARRNAMPERVLEMRDTFYSDSKPQQQQQRGRSMRKTNGSFSGNRSISRPEGQGRLTNGTNASFTRHGTQHSSYRQGEGRGRGGLYPQDREGYMIDYEEGEDGTFQFYDDDDNNDAEAKARMKEKKKKKKKAKKKKKKSKRREIKGEDEDEDEDEEEEAQMEIEFLKDTAEGFSLYSELEMSEK